MNKPFNPGALISLLIVLAAVGCSQKPDPELGDVASCEGCHTNYIHLKEVYTPDTAAVAGGCGGDAPHYEPYDRVYMGDAGFEDFKTSAHYQVGCTGCHNGTDKTSDKNVAHSGDFLAHPSDNYEDKCGTCHSNITGDFSKSLHNGIGQRRKVAMRSGLNGPEEFDMLSEHKKEGYTANCAICHGTCGNCHVVRPPAAGGGLSKGHQFTKSPDMFNICIGCHSSRVGHAYLGVSPGSSPDVHLTKNGYECLDCHTGAEVHGTTESVELRYAYSELPSCDDCHTGIETANSYHQMHYTSFNCQVCHSQDYNNCGSCHIHDEGARVPSYMGFKIAKNPIPDVKTGFNLTVVRRTLAAPDNWSAYGVDDYANFEAFPTYNFATPHNIQRWTVRTQSSGNCYDNCHIRNDNGTLVNKEFYLFKDDLLEWEHSATDVITVDNALPSSWFTK